MNEYDPNIFGQNSFRNDEPEKPLRSNEPLEHEERETPEPVAPVEPEYREEQARPAAPVEPEHLDEQSRYVSSVEPEYRETVQSFRTAAPGPEQAAEPSYRDYFYSSGPARTARPAQAGGPVYGTPNYASPNYNTPNYGTQSYGAPRYAAPQPAPEQKPKKRGWKRAVAAVLACVILSGAAGMGGALLVNHLQKNGSAESAEGGSTNVQVAAPRETKDLNVVTVDSGKLMTASQVYKNNVNSTVGITTEVTTNYWGFQSTGAAAGSGFILTEDGYILTNEHVIEDSNSITVAMYDGTSYPATVVGYDANNDIAVLKIDATGLTPVTLGNSDAIEVGDEVVAIGNPLGELTFSLTKGNVSALNRSVTFSRGVSMNLIQTDAAINSGNSGGALFNMYGEVIGITNAKYSSSSYSSAASIDNIGFAIPINSVRGIVSSIIEKGYVSTPYIGVTVGNVSQESQDYGLPKGAAIRSVEKGSPAEQAGLQANDIVTAVNGETISSYEELGKIISASEVGDALELTVYRLSEDREGKSVTLTVTVGERIQDAIPNSSSQGSSGYSGGTPWYPDNP